jgi:GNAT superfamily N-acetyltransferase
MAVTPDYSIIEQNLRSTMPFFGYASGRGAVQEDSGVLMIDSGVNYAVFNIAMLTAPVGSREELDGRLTIAAEFFRRRGARWSKWVCIDLMPKPVRKKLGSILESHHLRPLTDAPGMIAERLLPPTRPLPYIRWRPVEDAQTRLDFTHLTSINFEIPFSTCRQVYEREAAWESCYRGYIGYTGRTAVVTMATVTAAQAIGIYSVGTLPDYRHRGYAEALMRQVIADIGRTTGIERTVLQATRAGHQMYLRMGYRDSTRFVVYIS